MKIKLNNGLTLRIFEPKPFLSDNAFVYYSNSDYKIAIDEKSKSNNRYYVLLNNHIACGPTDWVEIEEFFNDLYKLFIE